MTLDVMVSTLRRVIVLVLDLDLRLDLVRRDGWDVDAYAVTVSLNDSIYSNSVPLLLVLGREGSVL